MERLKKKLPTRQQLKRGPTRRLLVAAFTVGTLLLFFGEQWLGGIDAFSQLTYQKLNLYVLFLTALFIGWYTIETRGVKETSQQELAELKRQTKALKAPYLKLEWKPIKYRQGSLSVAEWPKLRLTNVGPGVAKNILIESLVFDHDGKKVAAIVQSSSVLPGNSTPESTSELSVAFSAPSQPFDRLDPRSKENEEDPYQLQVSYEDVDGRPYQAVFSSDPQMSGGYRISSQSARE